MSTVWACMPRRAFRPLSKRLTQLDGPSGRATHSTTRPSTILPGLVHLQPASLGRTSTRQASQAWRPQGSSQGLGIRAFSESTYMRSKAIMNPRKDDDGNDMLVEISPRAADRLHAIAEKDSNPSLCLRVTVESGGCHGFQYLMSLTSLESVSQEEDVVFESGDGRSAKVVLDESSLELLKGSTIDYTMELIGSQFKVTGIPGAKSSCGCGTSFDIQA